MHEEIERIKSENGLILKEEQNKNLLYEEKINVLEAKIKAINRKSENEKEDYEEEIARVYLGFCFFSARQRQEPQHRSGGQK